MSERTPRTISELQIHVDGRLDKQDAVLKDVNSKVTEMYEFFAAHKVLMRIVKWTSAVAASAVTMWYLFFPKK